MPLPTSVPITNINTNISGVNLTDPSSTANSVVTAIKYGTAVTVGGNFTQGGLLTKLNSLRVAE
jgi:hypothetical protein